MKKSKKNYLNKLKELIFDLINSLYNKTKDGIKQEDADVEPIEFIDKYKLNDMYKYYEDIGKKQ